MNKNLAVVIPIYKDIPSNNDVIALKQCYRILKTFPIVFVAPRGMKIKPYLQCIPNATVKYLKTSFFTGIASYNQLMMSRFFYKKFITFHYILIYQTDSYIFKDELQKWMDMDFDYIGAPWFKDCLPGTQGQKLWAVGNGGFSLRKVKSFLKITNAISWIDFPTKYLRPDYPSYTNVFQRIKSYYVFKYNFRCLFKNFTSNEDLFWGYYVHNYFKGFKVAPTDLAMKFAFDSSPDMLFQLNHQVLPLGCHAWPKYYSFWSTFIHEKNPV